MIFFVPGKTDLLQKSYYAVSLKVLILGSVSEGFPAYSTSTLWCMESCLPEFSMDAPFRFSVRSAYNQLILEHSGNDC